MSDKFSKVYEKMNLDITGKVPKNIEKLCYLLAKTMKQTPVTILLTIISMFSIAVGHATVKANTRWNESVQLWIVLCMKTGRGKSTIHKFISQILVKVIDKMEITGMFNPRRLGRDIIMPHCTWEKFGEIMAINGGRMLCLSDELTSFFATTSVYLIGKGKTSNDTNQAEFLSMFNGGSKRRETITGNANYNMTNSHMSMMGFTQPELATSVIMDITSTNVSFANSFLWYFPKPMYSKFRDLEVSSEEESNLDELIEVLVESLTNVYKAGENCTEYQNEKIFKVSVSPARFNLSEKASLIFTSTHDDFEALAEKYEDNNFLSGLYNRGKTQILRMSCVIEMMNSEMEKHCKEADDVNILQWFEETLNNAFPQSKETTEDEVILVGENSMNLACHFVKISLKQLETLYGVDIKKCNNSDKVILAKKSIIAIAGKVVSGPITVKSNRLRQMKGDVTLATFTAKIFEELEMDGLGKLTRRLANNNSTTLYFKKIVPDEKIKETLEQIGISFEEYSQSYYQEDNESEKHQHCFNVSKKRKHPN